MVIERGFQPFGVTSKPFGTKLFSIITPSRVSRSFVAEASKSRLLVFVVMSCCLLLFVVVRFSKNCHISRQLILQSCLCTMGNYFFLRTLDRGCPPFLPQSDFLRGYFVGKQGSAYRGLGEV